MLRAALLGVLVSVSACSKSATESSAKVTAGAAAGKVLEVKGSVTVKHGDATKPLAVGETVEGDDTVITGADGNVVIQLAHNSARWELGPNKQQRVRESIAWNAKQATAEEVNEASAAAGRHAERSAAGTVATAEAPPEEAPRAEAAMDPSASAAPASTEPDMMPKGGGGEGEKAPAPRPRATKNTATAPKAPKPKSTAPDDLDGEAPPVRVRTRGGGGTESAKAPMDSPAPGGGGSRGTSTGSIGAGGGGGGTATAAAAPPTATMSAPNPAAMVRAKTTALHQCLVDQGAKEDVTLAVELVNGKATVKVTSKAAVSAALDKCLKGVISGISFGGSSVKFTQVVKP